MHTIGSCTWSLCKGVLTIAPIGDAGDLPASWVVDDGYPESERWLWCDLLGDCVHDVHTVVIEHGVRAGRSLSYLFGYSEYDDETEAVHSFDNVRVIDLSGLECARVAEMVGTFFDCTSLQQIVPPDEQLKPQPTDVTSLFEGCASLVDLDLAWIDFSQATCLDRAFARCASLERLDISCMKVGDDASLDALFVGCDLGYRVKSTRGLDARVAREMAFARKGSVMAAQLVTDMRAVERKMEAFAHCKPTTVLQMTSYLHAAHEATVEWFAIGPQPSLGMAWRMWRLSHYLDGLLESFAEEPTEDEVRRDEEALAALMRCAQSVPRCTGKSKAAMSDDVLDYLSAASTARFALTSWTQGREHHKQLLEEDFGWRRGQRGKRGAVDVRPVREEGGL